MIKICKFCNKEFKTRSSKRIYCGLECTRLSKIKKNPTNKDRFYKIYYGILNRCKNKNYYNYGGRGIKNLWKSFDEFKEDMYESYLDHVKNYGEKQTTIDRIDNNGNYCKENCRWATNSEQCLNRRTNLLIKFKGKTKTLTEWSSLYKINRVTLTDRINSGWSIEDSLLIKPKIGNKIYNHVNKFKSLKNSNSNKLPCKNN